MRSAPLTKIVQMTSALAAVVAVAGCATTDDSALRRVGAADAKPVTQVLEEIRTTQPQPDHPQIEPDVGSYYFHVALDRRCPAPSTQRTEAIDRLKQQFLVRQRQFVASVMRGRQLVLEQRRLDDVERDGPPARELAAFDVYLAGIAPRELVDLCRDAPVRITERIAAEKQMGESRRTIEAR